MNSLRMMWRMLVRDGRAGELNVLALALVLAVAALTAVATLADRVDRGMARQAHEMLAGDLLLTADHPWPAAFRDEALRRGLAVAESAVFLGMATVGEEARLAEVKAVGTGYPLRGALRVSAQPGGAETELRSPPPRGTAWVEQGLAGAPQLRLGAASFSRAAILDLDPERGLAVFSFAPRIIIHLDDLAGTALVQPGSRISWRLHVAGGDAAVDDFRRWATGGLGRGERLETIENARPEVQSVLDRAGRFLRLAAVLTLVLTAVAVGLAVDRYLRRHLDACALMRCIGASGRTIMIVHGGELIALALLAIAVGAVLGVGLHFLLLAVLDGLLAADLPPPSWRAPLEGMTAGLVLVAGFVLPPLRNLRRVSTLRVLRREWQPTEPRRLAGNAFGATLIAGMVIWLAGGWKLGVVVVAGFAVAALVAAATGQLLLSCLHRLRHIGPAAWRLGIAGLRRRRQATLLQLAALTLGLMALLVLTIARGDLLATWRARMPPDAPNRFVINLQPDQRTRFADFFASQGLPSPTVEPMVRGRLVAINNQPLDVDSYADERARRLAEREFNLSWSNRLAAGNTVIQGAWFGDDASPQFSVEQGLADTLGLRVGDRLTYQIGGEPLSGPITSLRKLDWDSMRVNFFVVAPPAALQRFPASYITSFHLPSERAGLVNGLLTAFPNLTVIDVGMVMRQLQGTLDRLAGAVEGIFGLSLAAGLVVLYAGMNASADERSRELALMRALGGRRRRLRGALLAEFLALGAVSGLLAGCGAAAVAYALGRWAFRLDYLPSPWLPVIGVVAGAVMVAGSGVWLTRDILRRPLTSELLAG